MKMFLLRTKTPYCDCGQAAFVIFRAESETEARKLAHISNSHGFAARAIDWTSCDVATCNEFPFLDGPKGIVVGSWFEQQLPG